MNNDIRIYFTKISDDAIVPKYAHSTDAACDLFSTESVSINPMERALVGTGLKIAIPEGFEGQIRPRSGQAWKRGLTVINTPGTIDAGYRGEVKVALINLGQKHLRVNKGERIAQMKFSPVFKGNFVETSDLEKTLRGESGLGSTGRG